MSASVTPAWAFPFPPGSTTLITGSGSSWASNAVAQWISDVQQSNVPIVFTPVGSAEGRQDFANKTVDFAVSDIGYQGKDPLTGATDTSQGRQFAYVPIVAGGTAFPYQIRVGGQLVRNLRLSGLTLAKIFTNQITNWDDPEITADNNGRKLPSIPIIPVVHSEGAGTTAQFTEWMATEYPSLWRPYSSISGMTEYWPQKGSQIAQNGSDGVMNFVSSAAGQGSIGVDEYSYALAQSYPVAKIENTAHYFTAPTQYNVAVALTQAQINLDKSSPNYLLETLTNVYSYNDPRTYPLSSYSYMIEPTANNDSTMTTAKRQTLVDYLFYSICPGQAEMGPIGYSPLPINLVERSFQQIGLLHAADAGVNLSTVGVAQCNNPTFDGADLSKNELAVIAPEPPACDKAGAGPCTGNQGLTNGNPLDGKPTSSTPGNGGGGSSGNGGGAGGGNTSGSPSSGSGGGATAGGTGSTKGGGSTTAGGGAATTGGSGGSNGSGGAANGGASEAALLATPTVISGSNPASTDWWLYVGLALVVLVAVLVAPPYVSRRRAGMRGNDGPA